MLVRVELVRLLSESKEESGVRLITWSKIGLVGLYEHRKQVLNLLKRSNYVVNQTSEGIEISKK